MVRRTRAEGAEPSNETICGITSLPAEDADEHRLLALNRGHWSIENKLHLPRDTTYREDHSRIRKHPENEPQTRPPPSNRDKFLHNPVE